MIGDMFGMMTAYMLSVVGSAVGWYIGRRISQEYL